MHCTFCLCKRNYSLHQFIPILLDSLSLLSFSYPEFSDSGSVLLHPSQGTGDKAECGAFFDGTKREPPLPQKKASFYQSHDSATFSVSTFCFGGYDQQSGCHEGNLTRGNHQPCNLWWSSAFGTRSITLYSVLISKKRLWMETSKSVPIIIRIRLNQIVRSGVCKALVPQNVWASPT